MLDSKISGVRVEYEGAIAKLSLSRPAAGNALGGQTGTELKDALEALETRKDVRCLLILAEGRAFCVGGDLVEFSQLDPLPPAIDRLVAEFHAACAILARLPFPVISVVQGAAAGAGVALAALSDIAIASPAASFTYAYPKVGFSSDGGLTWLLPRLMGVREFQKFVLFGKILSAAEALTLGLISEIVDENELVTRAEAVAEELSSGPTRAFGEIRRLLNQSMGSTYVDHLAEEQATIVHLAGTQDARAAIPAILSREAPTYVGR